MKLKIDDVEYSLIPIPPYASPYATLIGELLKKKAVTVEEAEKNSGEIKRAMEKLFSETVTPEPKPEHHIQVFNALSTLTNKVMEEAGLFRQDQRPKPKKSSTTSLVDSQASK